MPNKWEQVQLPEPMKPLMKAILGVLSKSTPNRYTPDVERDAAAVAAYIHDADFGIPVAPESEPWPTPDPWRNDQAESLAKRDGGNGSRPGVVKGSDR